MALADARKNFASSLVATAPSPATSGTSLVVTAADGAKFPAASFNAVVCPANAQPTTTNAEIVRVTNVSTDTLTITRSVESTSARTIVVGDRIYTSLTAVDYPAPSATITTIQPDDAAAAGTAESYARGDHKHAIDAAAAGAIADTAAEGSSTSFARADHGHTLPVWGHKQLVPFAVPTDTTVPANNTYFGLMVQVFNAVTLTGVEYVVGTASGGNVRSALYTITVAGIVSTRVADRTSNLAGGAANARQQVAFDSTYAAAPGVYLALLWFSSTAGSFRGNNWLSAVTSTGTNATTTPTTPANTTGMGGATAARCHMGVY